ncbi:hypothetical protein ACT8ZV_07010 [Nocardioides sp. MAHUQ-72]|uniref:hypothetical protein n=1 Tax=unclassified Nocardioides TaxID=2615069 RepID=UPI00360C1BA1
MEIRPDGSNHLSDGVVVETHLLARVLGVRLLRVDGVVLVSPARLAEAAPVRVTADGHRTGGSLVEAARLLDESDATLRRCRDLGVRLVQPPTR